VKTHAAHAITSRFNVNESSSLKSAPFKSRVFLFGADMKPATVLNRWAGGRFISIACADGILTQGAGLGKNAFGPEVWGIVVETGVAQRGSAVPLTLGDGSPATAMLTGDVSSLGTPADILAEANYWELPQSYRDRIRAHIGSVAAE